MHQSKLFTLLRGLKSDEIRWFQKFLKSPFYNTNEQHIKLFEYIKKYYPDLNSPKLCKEATCKKLFPKEKFNIQKIRKLMHGLTLLVEEFMVVMRLKNNPYQKKRLLVSELGERNVYELFKKGTEELVEELEALPYRDAFFYSETSALNLEFYEHIETNKQTTGMQYLTIITEHLDSYYLLQRQRLVYNIKEHETIFINDLKIKELVEIKKVLKNNSTFQLYELLFKALEDKNDHTLLEIQTLFKKEINRISDNDKLEIIRILFNYWTSQVNIGRSECVATMFSLYKFGLKQQLIVQDQQISETTFLNITTIGSLEHEFDWTENFIKNYKRFLPELNRKNIVGLSYGLLFFKQKKYNETIDLLSNHPFTTPLFLLNSKAIILRAYCEFFLLDNSYYDFLNAQLQAFEKFIRRNKTISAIKQESYLNFVMLTKKVVYAISDKTLDRILYRRVKNKQRVIYKSWLLEKMDCFLMKK